MYHPTVTNAGLHDAIGSLGFSFRRHDTVHAAPSAKRKLAYSMRPLRAFDMARALRIAAANFGNEINLIARSYLWHFSCRAGYADVGAMWKKRSVEVREAGTVNARFDCLSSFIHGSDVAWIDLAGCEDSLAAAALTAFRNWPQRHRLLVIRVDLGRVQSFLNAGFRLAGEIPDGSGKHVYLHATRRRVAAPGSRKIAVKFGSRCVMDSDCEFSVVERAGSIIGLTGVYAVDFWRDVTWGAWGAVDPASARRDAVFEMLRLTEQQARIDGSNWFCLETSDSEKYRHARRIYELYGLQLLLTIPDFYPGDSREGPETLMIYGKRLDDCVPGAEMPSRAGSLRIAA